MCERCSKRDRLGGRAIATSPASNCDRLRGSHPRDVEPVWVPKGIGISPGDSQRALCQSDSVRACTDSRCLHARPCELIDFEDTIGDIDVEARAVWLGYRLGSHRIRKYILSYSA